MTKPWPTLKRLIAHFVLDGTIHWQITEGPDFQNKWRANGFRIDFFMSSRLREKDALRLVAEKLKTNNVTWLRPIKSLTGRWIIDLDGLRAFIGNDGFLSNLTWMHGRMQVVPEYDLRWVDTPGHEREEAYVWFDLPPEDPLPEDVTMFPELEHSLGRFKTDHPNPLTAAFVMMRYETTRAHEAIFASVAETCDKFGIAALRADEKTYAEDLLLNIRTYMHGCGFGIAIFERLTGDDFNPNVSLELGYMIALGKPACLLKDQTLTALHTDLVGRLYQTFDPQDPVASVPVALERWLRDREIVV